MNEHMMCRRVGRTQLCETLSQEEYEQVYEDIYGFNGFKTTLGFILICAAIAATVVYILDKTEKYW